jgi:hypothetical protein
MSYTREEQEKRLSEIETDIKEIRKRIFNGLAQELRQEVDKSVGGVRAMVIGILISMLLGLAGIIIEGRISSGASTDENMRNYKAILELDQKVDEHIRGEK